MRGNIVQRIGLLSVCILLTGCHLSHEWQEANCTQPRTCIVGGETEGEALGHVWERVSCTEPRVCSVCGESDGQVPGHVWSDATCTEARTCQLCGETEGEPLGHSLRAASLGMPAACEVCGESDSLTDPDIHVTYDAETGTVAVDEVMEAALKMSVACQRLEYVAGNLTIWEKAFDWSVNEILTAYFQGTVTKQAVIDWIDGYDWPDIPGDMYMNLQILNWVPDENSILAHINAEGYEWLRDFFYDCIDEISNESDEKNLTESADIKYIPSPYGDWGIKWMSSVGEVKFPVFVVDFPDVKYSDMRTQERMEECLFTGENSVASFYEESSSGRLHMEGDVYFYTARHEMGYYEQISNGIGIYTLIDEILGHFDSGVDFSQYDKDGDSVMDAFVVSVPEDGDAEFWWSSTDNSVEWLFRIDGLDINSMIVCRNPLYEWTGVGRYQDGRDFIATMKHELGHRLGLPDYYKYYENRAEPEIGDTEMLHGPAGYAMMEDSLGDFSQFSKLQLGWLREDQVKIMPADAEKADFLLPPNYEGGCILVFPEGQDTDFQGEYFLIEQNLTVWSRLGFPLEEGVRIFHVQADIIENNAYGKPYYWYRYYKGSREYDKSNEGRAVLKLVNDGNGYYREGQTVTYENAGGEDGNFGWYTEDGKKVTNPGFSIQIGELQDNGCIAIEIIRDGQ